MRDRWSGGMLAALAASLVFIQVVFSAWACVASIRAGIPSTIVVCHGSGTATVEIPSPEPPSSDAEHQCPCGILCGIGLALAAPSNADLGAVYASAGTDGFFPTVRSADGARGTGALRPYPTGPPKISA